MWRFLSRKRHIGRPGKRHPESATRKRRKGTEEWWIGKVFIAMLGRLLFEVNELDKWRAMLFLPSSITCFNKMDLPNNNRKKLAEQLFKASRQPWASATLELDAGCVNSLWYFLRWSFVLHTRVHASHPPRHLQAPGAAAPPPRLP